MVAIRAGIAELLWFIFSGRWAKDFYELWRYHRLGGVEVVFFYKAGIDEQWLSGTAAICGQRRRTAIVVNPRAALPHQARSKELFHISQFSVYWLHCRVFVSTSTLSSWNVPRVAEFIVHIPHSLVSLHAAYTPGAFDHYTELFSAGPHHTREWEAMDRVARRPPRHAFPIGYSKLDSLSQEFREVKLKASAQKQVLLAPSWGQTNILEMMGLQLIEGLLSNGFEVILRPHPLQMHAPLTRTIVHAYGTNPNFRIEDPASTQSSLYTADLMISDYSGVALEFAFLRLRPVLFIDVPPKISNPAWNMFGVPLAELELRPKLGQVLPPNSLDAILKAAVSLAGSGDAYGQQLLAARSENLYNFGSAQMAASQEIDRLLASAPDKAGKQ